MHLLRNQFIDNLRSHSSQNSNIAFTAPHWAASEAGIAILQEGGTATEAMVAAAAVISVVYPHMNSIAGDGFWLIDNLNEKTPIAIDACAADQRVTIQAISKCYLKCHHVVVQVH